MNRIRLFDVKGRKKRGGIVTDKRVNYERNGRDFSFNLVSFRRVLEGNSRDEIVGVRFERGEG